jgi:Zinc carboxypeptidase/PA domain/Chitobiase/beta-hexosaminidase C-terminal domain
MAIRRAARAVTVVAVGVLGFAVAAPAQSQPVTAQETEQIPPIERSADESADVVEVSVTGVDELDELVATGVDLDHHVTRQEDRIVVHAVVTPSEADALRARGFALGRLLHKSEDSQEAVAEREATIAAHVEENEAFAAAAYDDGATAPDVSDVKIIRADYYTSFGNPVLSVEAKWAGGQGSTAQLTVERDSGPGTEFGSGGTQNISRFVDAGVYLYHRGASSVTTRPDRIRIVSPTGDVAIAKVDDWLPLPGDAADPSFQTGFITSYLTPTELYDRIHQLAADFPGLAEVVELPYKTNGYRRQAQALLDPPGNRLVVDPPSQAAGTYGFAAASYGPAVPAAGVAGAFAVVNDGSALPTEGCGPLVGFPAGAVALVDRGTCPFVQKTQNAQDAGAIAVVIVNNVGGAPTSPGGSGTFAIPTVMISQDDGNLMKASLPATGRLLPGAAVSNAARVGVDSIAWGHEGGNDVTVQAVDPGVPDSPLTVGVSGQDITVSLATNAAGTRTSTAAQVRDALNADAAASALVLAYTYRGSAGNGVVPATERIRLSDNLSAPDSVSREPHPVYALRIGKHRDGSKMGVLAYAQEHAREWVPPLVTIETAERLLRNYAQHGPTKQLLNNLDIWIAPSINPDGGHYSFYDFASQRRNMTRHCPVSGAYDVNARNAWGVDNNRNYDTYSLFDGYDGASTSCTSDVFAGPSELSEPENKNLDWLASRPNVSFAMNLHSSGNYFMWSPGAYQVPGRISAPRPTLEEESFFWGASSRILTAIKEHRGLSVTPARTGPISDVLYSAAGNSGDMLWYKHGIYAWNFEVGTSFQPPFEGTPTGGSALQESQEFANGLVELMRVAYDFGKDRTRPESFLKVQPGSTQGKVIVTFETTEPAAVFYTLDGSVPTYDSTLYGSAGIREGGEMLQVDEGTTVHWFSVDSAGNVERNYRPDGKGRNFGKGVAVLAP